MVSVSRVSGEASLATRLLVSDVMKTVANTIDGGTGAIRRNGIHRCGADGGSLGVVVNSTHPTYSLPLYVDTGAKPAGIVIKIVANL
jgi:hypothetical protein